VSERTVETRTETETGPDADPETPTPESGVRAEPEPEPEAGETDADPTAADVFDGPLPGDPARTRTTVDPAEATDDRAEHADTGRWGIGLPMALVAGTAGLVSSGPGTPVAFAAAVVGLAYAAYGYATRPPAPAVVVDRAVTDTAPLPGSAVSVALTVENVSDRAVADLRLVDRVPDDLAVEGAPTFATTLQPGETDRLEYTVRARRGDHDLGPATLVLRNVSGSEEYRRQLRDSVTLSARASPDGVSLGEQTTQHTGRVDTDQAGPGIEFHSTRQYYRGDPMRRIDWNRYASTGELTTVDYSEERAAVVVVFVDVRSAAALARDADEPDGVELCEYAAEQIASTLLDRNDRVGVALYGEGSYLAPDIGRAQNLRIQQLLREGPAALHGNSLVTVGYGRRVSTFRKRLPPEAQVVLVSPLIDDAPTEAVTELEAHGHPTRVVTPDVTAPDSVGGTVARVERADRVGDMREAGVDVVEWSPDEPLYTAITRAERRWSQ
jgi:uncharacterized protein (DUF58 family)